MSKIILQRQKAFLFCMRAFKVIVDGQVVAKISNGQQVVLDLAAGEHELSLKFDWKSSEKLRFSIAEGGERHFTCEPSMSGPKLKPSDSSKVEQIQASGGGGLDMTLEFNWQTVIVFTLLIGLIVVIGGRFYAFARLKTINAVDHITTNNKTICVHHNNTLHLLTVDGQLQQSITLSELDLKSSPADIELLNDGSLLIGDSQTNTIYKCDIIKKTCDEIAPSAGISIDDNFKFFVDDTDNILYISDTNNHRLIAHDLKKGISAVLNDVKLKYPNDLAINSKGVLHIADTKNSRVISVELVNNSHNIESKKQSYVINLDGYPEPKLTNKNIEAIAEKAIAGAVSNYPSPLALAQASNQNWWVVVSDAYIDYGELWIFNVSGNLERFISLSEKSIPLDIIRVKDNILVTDTEENQVYSINAIATRIEPFGDENFQDLLLATKKERAFYRAVKNHSFTLLGILLLAFLLMLFVIKRKQDPT